MPKSARDIVIRLGMALEAVQGHLKMESELEGGEGPMTDLAAEAKEALEEAVQWQAQEIKNDIGRAFEAKEQEKNAYSIWVVFGLDGKEISRHEIKVRLEDGSIVAHEDIDLFTGRVTEQTPDPIISLVTTEEEKLAWTFPVDAFQKPIRILGVGECISYSAKAGDCLFQIN
jgi:hypothetical protein